MPQGGDEPITDIIGMTSFSQFGERVIHRRKILSVLMEFLRIPAPSGASTAILDLAELDPRGGEVGRLARIGFLHRQNDEGDDHAKE